MTEIEYIIAQAFKLHDEKRYDASVALSLVTLTRILNAAMAHRMGTPDWERAVEQLHPQPQTTEEKQQ